MNILSQGSDNLHFIIFFFFFFEKINPKEERCGCIGHWIIAHHDLFSDLELTC